MKDSSFYLDKIPENKYIIYKKWEKQMIGRTAKLVECTKEEYLALRRKKNTKNLICDGRTYTDKVEFLNNGKQEIAQCWSLVKKY